VSQRRLSPEGRSAGRPDVAWNRGTFGVVWKDLDQGGVRFQPLDAQAAPLGPVVALDKSGVDPRLVADGDGFVVSWTSESGIALLRVDAHGQPRGAAISLSTSSARTLALAPFGGGWAVVWWSWSNSLQAVTFLDAQGHAREVELSRGPLVDPAADLLPSGDALQIAWEEQHDGVEHVFVGHISPSGLQRLDVGPGAQPSLTQKGAVFAHLDDASIWWSPLDVARPARFTDGQYPDARPLGPERGVLCVVRLAVTDDASFDELDCLTLWRGDPLRDDKVATAARGMKAQAVATGNDNFAVAWETQEADAEAVHLATVSCPAVSPALP
jgi:hypothetical protein